VPLRHRKGVQVYLYPLYNIGARWGRLLKGHAPVVLPPVEKDLPIVE